MSLDTRNNSALFKRAEQLKRWEESDTNREPVVPKNVHARKIKFSSGCVFLAACMSGDKDEVLRLLDNGADIDTANVDGLTALHQACIDDNLDMVEFLVQHGSGVNRADNEGWTPLHATASCGFVSIARYLLENGADLRAVNSDGELAIDLSASNSMENLLQMQINEQGINCEEARQCEERMMLNDAKKWLRSDASEADRPHGRTGATSLHVAAAKGYTKVLTLLLAGRADVDKQDNDGWTPLHAAAHWGQKEAAQMLVASLADMDIKNYAGQTALDVADPDIIRYLTELRTNSKRNKRRTGSQLRFPDNMDSIETPPKVIRVEVKPELKEEARLKCLDRISESDDASDSDDHYTESTESTASSISETLDEKPKPPSEPAAPRENNMEEDTNAWRRSGPIRNNQGKLESPTKTQVPDKEPQPTDSEVILRRTQSFENDEKFYQKYRELRERIKANSCPVLPATPITGVGGGGGGVNTTNSYSVQRSASLKDHRQLRKTTVSLPLSPTTPAAITPTSGQVRSNQTKDNQAAATNSKLFSSIGGSAMNLNATVIDPNTPLPSPRHASSVQNLSSDASSMMFTNGRNSGARENINPTNNKLVEKNQSNVQQVQQQQQQQTTSQPPQPPPITTTSTFNKLSPGNIFKNFFKSFVPPVRDEESETQRKAHAKRVRETRRSTQGVTLDEIKSAEELVKKKNLNNNNNSTNNENPSTTTTTTSAINDRVPSTNVNDDNDDNNSKESATAKQEQSSGGGSSGSGISGDVIDEQITASYTITAPTICKRDNNDDKGDEGEDNENNDGGDDDGEDEEQISASYTISPPPISNNVSFNASIPDKKSNRQLSSPTSRVGGGGEGGGGSGGGGDSETTSITATINVPSSNIKKTDLEELTKTASPTVVQTSFKFDKLDNHKTSESEATDLDKEPTTQQSRYNRDKRSLFDIDNASSLSLAEKLRNEANKYSEANQSNNDLSTGLNHNKINSTELSETNDNSSNTSSNNSKKCDSTSSSPSHQQQVTAAERRPSWRIKFDAGSKFKLEDASAVNNSNQSDSATSSVTGTSTTVTAIIAQRRPNSINNSGITTITTTTNPRPVSAPIITNSNLELNNDRIKDAVNNDSDLALRRLKNSEDKENDKENDSRSAQATQAVIQRRKRPKRRSTGVVHVDMDDLDPDRQESPVDGDDKESGSERSSRTRLGSAGSTDQQQNDAKTENDTSAENGEIIDYKALYEASRAENNKLKQQLQKQGDTLQSTKAALERFTNATTKNSLSELEKRERRAMERKLSEMEEELKQLEALKTENQRLKDENGALIRVISKLSK